MKKNSIIDFPLFALGFRAFFLLAGISALILMALWRSIYNGHFGLDNYYSPLVWHGHEMLLGYGSAVLAGFLLTAVKNWTENQTLSGGGLAGLCLLWLYGRITPYYAGLLPDPVIALVDLAFLPALAWHIYIPIMHARLYPLLSLVGLLLLMSLGNLMIHAQMLAYTSNSAEMGLHWVFGLLMILIIVMAGRLYPFFTDRGLPGTISLRSPLLDTLSIASSVAVVLLDVWSVSGGLLATCAIFAAVVNGLRVANWYVNRVWYVPLLWVLYSGYGWIILGFVLMALSAFKWVLPSLAIHAFTIGGIGVITLAMMTRVSLGHTGRNLKASSLSAVAFVFINIAVFFRVILPIVVPDWYMIGVYFSTAFWLAAFSIFVTEYFPMWMQSRVDGKSG